MRLILLSHLVLLVLRLLYFCMRNRIKNAYVGSVCSDLCHPLTCQNGLSHVIQAVMRISKHQSDAHDTAESFSFVGAGIASFLHEISNNKHLRRQCLQLFVSSFDMSKWFKPRNTGCNAQFRALIRCA